MASTEMPGLLSTEDKEKIDNIAITYSLSGGLSSDNTYTTTLTASEHTTSATIPAMVGASSSNGGAAGLVPAPAKNDETKFLRGDGTWETPNYGVVSSTAHGLAPQITTATATISTQTDEWVLTSTKGGIPTWRKLPANAFKNDNTTYTLSGALSGNTFISTLTPLSGSDTTSTVPAMGKASSSTAGTAGLVPAPAKGDQNKVLSGGGAWITGSDIINSLSEGTTNANRNDYIVAQYTNGGTTTKSYHRRKLSYIFAALNTSDITTALGYTPYNSTNPNGYITSSGSITGNAATATTATNLVSAPSLATSGTTQITVTAGGKTSSAFTVPYATSAGSATTATNANNVYINTSGTNSYYPIPFVTSTSAGNKALYMDSSTDTASNSNGLRYNPYSNALYASGGFYESSDNKLKNYKNNIEVDLEKLSKLPKKYFTWKSDSNNTLHIGTSAQEVQKLYPELVINSGDFLAVDYAKLSVIALAAIDKLNEKINLLE